jgi:dienelactone hydrolase
MKITSASVLVIAVLLFITPNLHAQQWVDFPGTSSAGKPLKLQGILTVPEGSGRLPAVVMLPTSDGIREPVTARHLAAWAQRLAGWGYATLQVDSLGPRGLTSASAGTVENMSTEVAIDAFAAKAWLSTQPRVDPARIGVIGWSGAGTLPEIVEALGRAKGIEPFKAAVAFYPFCSSFMRRDTPLLIFVGGKDDWVSASDCGTRSDGTLKGARIEMTLKIYPNAYHLFDFEGLKVDSSGHHMEYNAEAAKDAIARTKAFLAKYLGGKR